MRVNDYLFDTHKACASPRRIAQQYGKRDSIALRFDRHTWSHKAFMFDCPACKELLDQLKENQNA